MAVLASVILRDTRANQPAAGVEGRLYFVTDESVLERDSGADWESIEGVSGGAAEGYILLQDQKSSGTTSGTFTSGADRIRVLNTKVFDTGGDCTLASNQFTLAAGTYRILARAPAFIVNRHQCFLYNVTDTVEVARGASAYAAAANGGNTESVLHYRFTIAGSKTFELRHRCETTSNTRGLGVECNFGTEIFAQVKLRREG